MKVGHGQRGRTLKRCRGRGSREGKACVSRGKRRRRYAIDPSQYLSSIVSLPGAALGARHFMRMILSAPEPAHDSEPQRGAVTCPGSHSRYTAGLRLDSRPAACRDRPSRPSARLGREHFRAHSEAASCVSAEVPELSRRSRSRRSGLSMAC